MLPENPVCRSLHTGLLACRASFVNAAVRSIQAGTWRLRAIGPDGQATEPPPPYKVLDGVGVVRIDGPMMKGHSKFGGTSTAHVRRQVRAMLADEKVQSILVVADSPGGYVAGTDDLARDIRAANAQKPVVAYVEDEVASAAYYALSGASAIYANPSGSVGSIGVFAVIEDTSKMAEDLGVKVHLISTGPLKGAGTPGTEVTPEMLAQFQSEVDAAMEHFESAVREGRKMDAKAFAAVATGAMFPAKEAKSLGLIDGIRSIDEVVAKMPKPRRSRSADLGARMAASEE